MNQNYNFVQGLFSQVMNGKNEALATKNSTSFKGFLLMIVFALFANMSVQGQSTANYAFSTSATGSLVTDANSNAIDMTTGTTQLVAAGTDDGSSIVNSIGFNFYGMGTFFNNFSANSNGAMALGNTAVGTSGTTNGGSATALFISPFGGDSQVNSTGKVHYKVIGAAPNRTLVVEWLNIELNYNSSSADGTFQVRLYETTGVIEYVYGSMNVVSTFSTGPFIGFSSGSTAGTIASITSSTNTVATTGTSYNANTYAVGAIDLNSVSNGSRRVYRFTPTVPASGPSALICSGVTTSATTLNWTAAASTTNAVRYIVLNSTNGGTTYNFVANVAIGTNTYVATGLTTGTTYTWRVVAVSEGVESTPTTATQATIASPTYYWVGTSSSATPGTFTTLTNWNTAADGSGTAPTSIPVTSVDNFIVDGDGSSTTGGNVFISLAASTTVGQFKVISNTALTLQAASGTTARIITVTGSPGDDFVIESGSTLNLTTGTPAGFAFSGTNNVGLIAGTLNFAGSVNNGFTTTGGTGTLITVASTGVVNLGAGANSVTGSAATLSFLAGSNCNSTTGTIYVPLATWDTTSTFTITGLTTSTSGPTNVPQSFGNIVYNCPLSTATLNFFGSTTTSIVKGNLSIVAAGSTGGTGIFRATSGAGLVTINGNVTISQGRFQATSTSTGSVIVNGNTTVDVNGILELSTSGSGGYSQRGATLTNNGVLTGTSGFLSFINLTGSFPQTLSGTGTVLTNLGTLSVQNTSGLTITHANQVSILRANLFQGLVTNSNKLTFGTGLALNTTVQVGATGLLTPGGSLDVAPTFNLGTGTHGVVYAQESVARTTGFEIPSTRALGFLTLSNSNGLTISGGALAVTGTLTMTSGLINTTATNLLTLGTATAAGTLSGTPSATNMIVGPFARTFATRTASGTYDNTTLFPLGKGTAYTPVFVDPTIAATSAATIRGEAFATNSGSASPDVTNLSATRWEVLTTSGFANLINANVRVQEPNILSTQAIVQSPTAAGVYDRLPATSTYSATGPVITGSGIGATALTASGYFAYGNVAPPQPPTVTDYSTAFSPGPNPTLCANGGSVVTIVGTNLATVTSVLFTGVGSSVPDLPGTITAKTSTTVTVTAPAGLIVTGGSVVGYIQVTNPVGSFQSPYHFFTAAAPTVTVTPNLTACAGANSTLSASGATTYSWAPNTALSAITGPSVTANPTTNTTYTVTGTDTLGCKATNTVSISTISIPSPIIINPTPSPFCLGSTTTLTATGGSTITVLSENFNSGIGSFTTTTLSSSANQNWAPQVNGYSYSFTPHTGSVSGFMMANSDIGGFGSTANTQLISPSFNTTGGLTNLSLSFREYLNNTNTAAAIEISDDNFITSTILRNQTSTDIGTAAAFNITTIAIPSTFENKTNVKIRFRFESAWGYWWAVDEIALTGNITPIMSWSSASSLYTDASTTISYTNQDTRIVYSRLTSSQTYTATATAANGCSSTATVTVNPLPLPSAPTAVGSSQCGARVPTASVAATSGAVGTGTFKWYDQQSGGTAVQTSTSTTLTSYSVSTTTTLYVSEVGVNGCESLRTPVTITVGSAPALTISAAPSAICLGASTTTPVTITSTLADFNEYTWAPTTGVTGTASAGYTFNPTATTNYVLSSLNTTTGCTNLANLTVTVNPLPVITSATTSVEPLCLGSSTTLTGTSLAQATGTAIIGTDTTLTSATSQPTAFCNRWPSYRMQMVYTAAELTAAGLYAGNITSMAFNITTLGDAATNSGFTVKMGTTSLSALSTFESTASFTTVYPSQTYTHTASGIQTIPFSTPFLWDGTSNIIIEMIHNGADATNNSRTYYTATANNTVAYTSFSSTDSASLSNNRLNVIFGGQVATNVSSSLNWSWSPAASLSAATGNVVTATPTASTVYTVTATNPTTSCSNTRTVGVTLLPTLASAPTATDSTHCGLQLSTATVTSTTTTVNPVFVWYNVATGGTSVQSGPSRTFLTAVNSTRTMYVSEVGSNGCESLRTPVVMTVTAPPTLSITSSVPTFCGTGGNATLTAVSNDSAMTYTWTSLTPSATISALNTPVVTASISETSEFKVVGIAANPSCLPIESFISVGVYPLPSATVTTTAQGLCPGTSATIGSGLSAGNFTVACIPAPSAPATSPLGAVALVGGRTFQTPYPAGVFANSATNLDDNFWGGIPVGFNFNFFGNTVTNVFIGSNGTINLGTSGSTAFTFSGFPSTSSPASTIAVVARDLHWDRIGAGKISYWTEGVAPNRRFIVQFLNATTIGTDLTTGIPNGKQTAEAVFYETLGTIDIRVFEATFANAKYIGLQDATQTIGASAPNCSVTPNTPNYWNGVTAEIPASAPRAWRFTPPSNYTTVWSANGVVMPSVAANPTATPPVVGYTNPGTNVFSIPVAPLATTTYSISYTNLTSGCSNAPGSAQVVMGVLGNVAPAGVNTIVSNSTICLGQSVNFSTSYTGLTDGIVFQWQNSIDGGTTWNDIASATSLTLTHTPLAPSKYRLKMVACNGVPGYTSEAAIGFFNNVVSSTPAVRCGVGTASLSATGSTGTTIKWYANPSGGSSLGTGTTFTTPSINTNTTYYAGAESFAAGSIAIGAGGTNSATSGRSFLPGAWGGSKTQYIIKASELLAAGIGAGNITSLGFEPTNSGQTYQGFSVSLAPVTANVMTTAFVSTGLTQVYAGTQADNGFTPVANTLNNLTFGTGTGSASSFNWDGSSNILISISRSSVPNATTSISTTMKVDDVGFVSTAYDLADNLDPATMLASTTADATTSFRPRFTINGQVVCSSSRVAVPVTVTPPPAITLSGNPATICAESNSTPVTVITGASDYSSYVWTPTSVTGNSTNGWVFNPLTTTTYTLLASQTTGATPCANNATVTVTVNPTPSVLTIAPVSTCANAITPIVSTGGTLDNMTILSQDFNGVTNNWTTVNNSTGGSAGPAVANWTLQSSGYVYSFYGPFASNDNSQFYMTNSDAQGSLGTTSTELRSPVFSTIGFTAANLSFFHHLYLPTTGNVEYTTNGGTTWTTIQSYTTTQGTATAFANANLALPAAMLNQSSVQLRFKYDDSWGYFWLIDNVSITGTQVATMVWSPTTNLYTDAAATIPYTGQNLSTVYFKNTSAASSVNYTATATSMLGCARVATVPVVVYQTAAPTGLQFFQFCPSGGATVGTMSPALIGTNIKWYSVSTGGTALAPTTPLSQGYYWASQTANGCESPTRFLVFAISNATAAPSSSPSQQFCNSATVANLTANGASLQWYSAATGGTALSSTTALSTGTYYVSQTSGGCESPRTAVSVTVTSVPAPTGAATQSLSSLLTLGDIVVTGSNITWYASAANAASGTNPLPSTQLLANTTYYATQTINGCRSAASLAVTITTLANQDFDMTQFTYYPNPVIDLLNITYSQDMTSVKVFNMIGQQLMSKQVNSNTIQVDMSSYANGAYFIQVTTENAMKTVRVIKK